MNCCKKYKKVLSIKTKLLFIVKAMYYSNPVGITLTFTSTL